MRKNWATKNEDMDIAQRIMKDYASKQNTEALGLVELVVNRQEKRMDFQLSGWVLKLAQHFKSLYGPNQGDFVTRQIISHCIIKDECVH